MLSLLVASITGTTCITGVTSPVAASQSSIQGIVIATTAMDQLEDVTSINLELAQNKAIRDTSNIALLQLKQVALQTKLMDLRNQESKMGNSQGMSSYALPDTVEKILSHPSYQIPEDAQMEQMLWLGPTVEINAVVNSLFSGLQSVVDGMNEMVAAQRAELAASAKQLELDGLNTQIELAEAKEGIKLQITGQYLQLLDLKHQLDLYKVGLELLEYDRDVVATLIEQGMAVDEDFTNIELEWKKTKKDIGIIEKNYQLALLQLSFDLGIRYNPNLVLEEVTIEPTEIERKSTEQIFTKLFELNTLKNKLNQSLWELSHTRTTNSYGKDYLTQMVQLDLAQEKIKKKQLTAAIEANYVNAEHAYKQLMFAQLPLQQSLSAYDKQLTRYELGLITIKDVKKANYELEEVKAKQYQALMNYYYSNAKVKAMEQGLIVSTPSLSSDSQE